MKKITKILFTVLTFILMIGITNAETISNSFTIKSYVDYNTPLRFPYAFKVKTTSTNKYAYCTYYAKQVPNGQTYTKGSKITDNGMNYILTQALNNANNEDSFFIYQTALWIYMSDKGIMPGPHQDVKDFKVTVNNSSSSAANQIRSIVNAAKKASALDTAAPSISISNTSNIKFNLSEDGTKYVSDSITINSSEKNYDVAITEGPEGTTVAKNGNTITISIPSDKVKMGTTTVKFSVNNAKTIYSVYQYTTSNSTYQTMAVPFKETKTTNASASVSLEKTSSVTISKQDIATSKELPGATLKLVNENGKVIDEWVSTNEPHMISNLKEGTYKLTETIAPEGYVLSEETIKFSINSKGELVNENGKLIDKIVMFNEKEETPEEPQGGGVSISKQDITNKEELPGATLVVKDYDGNIIDKWESTDKPHLIKNLKPGIYTLTETLPPNGYILSDETITFTVKDDGSITKVVMYNTPNSKEVVEVENTASFKTITSTVAGLSIIVIGLGLILKNKKRIN